MSYYSVNRTPHLEHYGIPGMEWGKRKKEELVGRTSKAVQNVASNVKTAANKLSSSKSTPTLPTMPSASVRRMPTAPTKKLAPEVSNNKKTEPVKEEPKKQDQTAENKQSDAERRSAISSNLSKEAKEFLADAKIDNADFSDRKDLTKANSDPSYNDVPDKVYEKFSKYLNSEGIADYDINVDDDGNYVATMLPDLDNYDGTNRDYFVKNLGSKKDVDAEIEKETRDGLTKLIPKETKNFLSNAKVESGYVEDRPDMSRANEEPGYNQVNWEVEQEFYDMFDVEGISDWRIDVDNNGQYVASLFVYPDVNYEGDEYLVKTLGDKLTLDKQLGDKYRDMAKNDPEKYSKLKNIPKRNTEMKQSDKSSSYYSVVRTSNEIAHSGIKGQKWGVQNGPPYPLDPSAKSVLEKREAKKAGKKAYGQAVMPKLEKKGIKYAAKRTTKLQKSINKHEKKIVNLAEKYKKNPTQENAEKFAKAIMNESIKQGRDIVKRDHFNEMSYTELGNMAKADTKLKINNGMRAVAGVVGTAGLIGASALSGFYVIGPGAPALYASPSIIAGTKNRSDRKKFETSYHSGQISEKDAKAIVDYAKARSNEILK